MDFLHTTARFRVPASLNQVVSALREQVVPVKWFRLGRGNASFEGEVGESGFSIKRIIGYKNPARPILCGKFEGQESGTFVDVRFTLHPAFLAFLCCWFGFLGLMTAAVLFSTGQDKFESALLFAGAMGLPVALVVLGGFWFEVGQAKRILKEVLAID